MIVWIIIGIATFSVALSIRSLRKESERREITSAKKELEKGKVLYKSRSSM